MNKTPRTCNWPGCTRNAAGGHAFCYDHWKAVPQDLRLRLIIAKGSSKAAILQEIIKHANTEAKS